MSDFGKPLAKSVLNQPHLASNVHMTNHNDFAFFSTVISPMSNHRSAKTDLSADNSLWTGCYNWFFISFQFKTSGNYCNGCMQPVLGIPSSGSKRPIHLSYDNAVGAQLELFALLWWKLKKGFLSREGNIHGILALSLTHSIVILPVRYSLQWGCF